MIDCNKDTLSVNELWLTFKKAIHDGTLKHIPHKTCKHKNNLPWITPSIKRLIRQRDRTNIKRKRARERNAVGASRLLDQKMRELKRKIQRESRKQYREHVESIISPMEEDTNDFSGMKRFWSFIKHSRRDSMGVGSLKKDGTTISHPRDKANILNMQFQSVFTRDNPDAQDIPMMSSPFATIDDIQITRAGIKRMLDQLKIHKAPGPDGITPRVMKELSEPVASILTIIFKKSYESGEIPDDWKCANITPIYKKGSKYDASNYRPISLTCISSKLMEHIIASSIMRHADNHNILYPLQHGFRDRRSCETQLLGFVNDLVNTMHTGSQTDILVMDFSKAFDKVSHPRLVTKLKYYGIGGRTNRWVQSFLSGRTQRVIVVLEGEFSDDAEVLSGVPQGSVLGPCLFLFYINDLPESLVSNIRLFADDTIVYLTIHSDSDTQVLQRDLDKLAEWETLWKMEFHPDKCEVLKVGRKRAMVQNDYTPHGKTLATADSAKYLGVTIASDLRWNKHIDTITSKANRTLGFLKKNLKINSTALKSTAYKTLVRPTLDYACTVWDPYTQGNIYKLEMVQRRAARFVLSRYNNTSSVGDMLYELGWTSLQTRRQTLRLCMMYKIHKGLIAMDAQEFMTPLQRRSRHVNSYAYKIPRSKTGYHMYSFFPRTMREWNSLAN